jgi:Protein of unknown function (DUF732)
MTVTNDSPPPPPNWGYGYPSPYPPPKNHNWVKWLVIGIIVLVVIIVVACIGLVKLNRHHNPTPMMTTSNTTQFTQSEQQYLAYLHKDGKFSTVDNTDIVTVGHDVCESFQGGDTLPEVTAVLSSSGVPDKQATELINGAVTYLCPDQKYKLPIQ